MSGNEVAWQLTRFYGEPTWDRKHLSWEYFHNLHGNYNAPWLVLGELNEILIASEKEVGSQRPIRMMQAFRYCLADCGPHDSGYIEEPLAWSKGIIRERVDGAICNGAYTDKVPGAPLIHEQHVHLDHRPLVLNMEYMADSQL